MSEKTWHSYQTRLPHHDCEEIEVDVEYSRSENTITVTVSIDDGKSSRIGFTMEELRGLVLLGERFEYAHNHMIGGEKP